MTRKAILIEAYLAGHSSREAGRIAGLKGGYVRDIIRWAGVSRPVGRPSSPTKGAGRAEQAAR